DKVIEVNQANEAIDKAFGEKYKNWEQAYKVYTAWLRDTEEGKEIIQKAFPASTIERIGGVEKYPNIAQLIAAIRNYYNGGIENGSVYTHLMGRLTDVALTDDNNDDPEHISVFVEHLNTWAKDFRKVFTKKTWDVDEVLLFMLAGAISGPGFGNVHFSPFMQDFHQNGVKAYKSADDFLQAIIQRETTMRASSSVRKQTGETPVKAAVGKAGGKGKGSKAASALATKSKKKFFCSKHRWNNSHKTKDCTKLKKELGEDGDAVDLTSVKDGGIEKKKKKKHIKKKEKAASALGDVDSDDESSVDESAAVAKDSIDTTTGKVDKVLKSLILSNKAASAIATSTHEPDTLIDDDTIGDAMSDIDYGNGGDQSPNIYNMADEDFNEYMKALYPSYAYVASTDVSNNDDVDILADSGASRFMTPCIDHFSKLEMSNGKSSIELADNSKISALGKGVVTLHLPDKTTRELKGALYVPEFRDALGSVSHLINNTDDLVIFSKENVQLYIDDQETLHTIGKKVGNLYQLNKELFQSPRDAAATAEVSKPPAPVSQNPSVADTGPSGTIAVDNIDLRHLEYDHQRIMIVKRVNYASCVDSRLSQQTQSGTETTF
ncbi:hypothetical protein HDU76_009571, partial [Blyttiomyces sp. JEL0837]